MSHGLSPSTSEVGPAGGHNSCVAGPSVNDPAATHMVGIDEASASHHRPLPPTNPQEALPAGPRSILPSAGAGPIDASPASGSDRPRSRVGPHGDMRGGTEDAGMGVALPPAPPTPRGEVLKSGGVDHSGELELGSEPEQEPALPGGAETEVAVPVQGAPCGEGGMSLGSSGFSPPGVPDGDSPYADNSRAWGRSLLGAPEGARHRGANGGPGTTLGIWKGWGARGQRCTRYGYGVYEYW